MVVYPQAQFTSHLCLLVLGTAISAHLSRSDPLSTSPGLQHPGSQSTASEGSFSKKQTNSNSKPYDSQKRENLTSTPKPTTYVNKYTWKGNGFPNTRDASLYPDEIPEGIQSMFYATKKNVVLEGAKVPLGYQRKKRQVDFPLHNIGIGTDADERDAHSHDTLPTCPPEPRASEMADTPLKCYQCTSDPSDMENTCGDDLWRYLSPREKYRQSIRCPANRGHYCAKTTRIKLNKETETSRRCMGPGPLQTNLGNLIELREGCLHYQDDTHKTITCYCKSELCNSSMSIIGGRNISTLFIFTSLLYFVLRNLRS